MVRSSDLAGEKLHSVFTPAPVNCAPLGGLEVMTESGWFAVRLSGAEEICNIYAESFRGAEHLRRVLEEAQAIVDHVIVASPARNPRIPGEKRI